MEEPSIRADGARSWFSIARRYYNRMVVGMAETERADALFHALADPTHRDILAVVLRDAHSVSALAGSRRLDWASGLPSRWPVRRSGSGRDRGCVTAPMTFASVVGPQDVEPLERRRS
jgi:hypothetical protein